MDKFPNDSIRLFFALWPDDATRAGLQKLQSLVRGRHTRYENFHITLAFLGEQPSDQLPLLKALLSDLPQCELQLSLDRLGYFKKNRIAWAGMHTVPVALMQLQSALMAALVEQGIGFDRSNGFKPHITLARDAETPLDCPFPPIAWQADQVTLVRSLQEGGQLAYRVLAARRLTEPA